MKNREECFACDGPRERSERPPRWLELRAACVEHKRSARLPSGMLVDELVATRTGRYPLEGSGLGYLLNPVVIAGVRAFTDWTAGGWAAYEELFPSANFFEFCVLHTPSGVEVLWGLFTAKSRVAGQDTSPIELVVRASQSAPNAQRFSMELTGLCSRWTTQVQIDAELRRRGLTFCRDADETESVFGQALARPAPEAEDARALPILIALAQRRFAHVG